jgi:hypothetical protein
VVPAVSPVRLLVKLPIPVPSVVWLPLMVGFCEVLQHTPRAVMAEPPSAVTLPPVVAEVDVMLLAAVVVTVGTTEGVVKLTCAP